MGRGITKDLEERPERLELEDVLPRSIRSLRLFGYGKAEHENCRCLSIELYALVKSYRLHRLNG